MDTDYGFKNKIYSKSELTIVIGDVFAHLRISEIIQTPHFN